LHMYILLFIIFHLKFHNFETNNVFEEDHIHLSFFKLMLLFVK